MKRSEMLKVLKDSFIKHTECPYDCCPSDNEMYSKILQSLEDRCMIHHRPVLMDNPNIKTDEDVATLPALIIKDVTGWEPEDA